MLSTIVSATALLASAVMAQTQVEPFYVYTMQGFDMRIPYVQHNISFNLNNPNNTYEDGGDNFGLCSIGWTNSTPTECYKRCESKQGNSTESNPSSTYYARLESFSSADAFNISILQTYAGARNTGQISIRSGQNGYYCSHGAQTTQCSIGFPFTPIQVPATKYDGGEEVIRIPLC